MRYHALMCCAYQMDRMFFDRNPFNPREGTPAFTQLNRTRPGFVEFDRRIASIQGPSLSNQQVNAQINARIHNLTKGRQGSRMPNGFRRMHRRRTVTRRGRRVVSRRSNAVPLSYAKRIMPRAEVFGVSRQMFKKANIFPQSMTTQITTSNVFRFDLGVAAERKFCEVALNSAYDPIDIPTSTQQALYFDQLKLLYNATKVHAAKITVQILQVTNNAMKIISAVKLGSDTAVPTDAQATSDPNNTFAVMYSFQERTNMISVNRYVNMKQFFARPIDGTFQEFSSEISDNTNRCVFSVWARTLDGTTLANQMVSFRVQLTQYVEFSDRKQISDVPPV